MSTPPLVCFNGAAFVRTRKVGKAEPSDQECYELQWGRVRENAERCAEYSQPFALSLLQWGRVRENAESRSHQRPPFKTYALQWGRVRENAERPSSWASRSPPAGFNGAAFVRTRKADREPPVPDGDLLLQWGRVRENAERSRRRPTSQCTAQLQWGRVRENAESRASARRDGKARRFNGAAFVRTRKVEHANVTILLRNPASMGPRS